jgi:hypothetical protein
MENRQTLEVVTIRCKCGAALGAISTNVLGMNASMKCEECGQINEFRHSLSPVADTVGHRCPAKSQSSRTGDADISNRT